MSCSFAVVEFDENGRARMVESSGNVELCERAPCAAGHAATEECDRCRSVCIGGFEPAPDAVPLPS